MIAGVTSDHDAMGYARTVRDLTALDRSLAEL